MVISTRLRLFLAAMRPALWASASFSVCFHFATLYVKAEELNSRRGSAVLQQVSAQARFQQAIESDKVLLDRLANDPRLRNSPKTYRDTLRGGPSLGFLYGEPSGVHEGYSIGQHTVRVLDLYFSQIPFYPLSRIAKPVSVVSWDRLMTYTLVFHDIGKSIAYRGGDKSRETVYSVPLASELLPAAGFNESETKIGVALIDAHQLIGQYLRGELSLAVTRANIVDHARSAKLPESSFFSLLEIVYVADAGSYPLLHDRVFRNEAGKLIPRDPAYRELAKLFF